ncbi:hypothetical protein DFH94DRAFT_482153 [Russula ochroleuca]|jgi:hypothetical protein|uniref:Uncharacterized protein n=1 Tax=Russula ochroleuca TaxID=152965 RepID=A0A9P5MPU2_9AGAM|nr:hypothetical protein DFH94DRAFT_482153 [Russula ochroleuca]
MGNSPRTPSIHILDDDSLLHVFYLYRPFLLGEDQIDTARLQGGTGRWVRGRWWYKPAHVCQRWRNLVLASATYLDVSLVCTYGTPVADMLAYSPPLPLVIDYFDGDRDMTEDEEGAILALKQRDRIRRVRLDIPVTSLQKIIMAMDEEYPILEYLIAMPPKEDTSTILILPETLQAPHLCYLTLIGFALPTRSRLLTTAVGLVSLCLFMNDPSTYFHPNTLLHWLSFMPQLETLAVFFFTAVPNHEIERQLTHTPIITPVTLPNLHLFRFGGVSAYLEALIHRITTPRLKKLKIEFFNRLTFSVPRLLQFVITIENLRFDSAKFGFYDERVYLRVYPRGEIGIYALTVNVDCWHLDWQVSSMAQISSSLSQMFSAVEHLALEHEVHTMSSEEHDEVDRTEWRKLLRSFRNVKTFQIDNGLVEQLSHCLELEDGELPLELLPELQELTYSGSGNTGDAFTSFINARQNAGRPVTLFLESEQDDPALVSHAQGFPALTSGSIEAGSNLDT